MLQLGRDDKLPGRGSEMGAPRDASQEGARLRSRRHRDAGRPGVSLRDLCGRRAAPAPRGQGPWHCVRNRSPSSGTPALRPLARKAGPSRSREAPRAAWIRTRQASATVRLSSPMPTLNSPSRLRGRPVATWLAPRANPRSGPSPLDPGNQIRCLLPEMLWTTPLARNSREESS